MTVNGVTAETVQVTARTTMDDIQTTCGSATTSLDGHYQIVFDHAVCNESSSVVYYLDPYDVAAGPSVELVAGNTANDLAFEGLTAEQLGALGVSPSKVVPSGSPWRLGGVEATSAKEGSG